MPPSSGNIGNIKPLYLDSLNNLARKTLNYENLRETLKSRYLIL